MANDFYRLKLLLTSRLKQSLGKQAMQEIGEKAEDLIRKRTRSGQGVRSFGGEKEKLKELSNSYKDFRKGKVAFFTDDDDIVRPYEPFEAPELSEFTTPNKSNLTFTGQLLESLSVLRSSEGRVEIGPTGTRDDGLTNKEVSGFVSGERPYLNLTRQEVTQIKNILKRKMSAILRKLA